MVPCRSRQSLTGRLRCLIRRVAFGCVMLVLMCGRQARNLELANVATWSGYLPGAGIQNLRRADETLASEGCARGK